MPAGFPLAVIISAANANDATMFEAVWTTSRRRMVETSQRLGRHRWTTERTGAWLGGWRRRRIRYERFDALAMLACSVICFSALQQPPW